MKKKYKWLIISLFLVVILCFIAVSTTYSWLLLSKEKDNLNDINSGKLYITYEHGQDITGTLVVANDNSSALTTTVTVSKPSDSVDGLVTIRLNVTSISEVLAVNAFKWEVYNGSQLVNSSTFAGAKADDVINLVQDFPVTQTATTFTIKLWLNGNQIDGSVTDQTFSGYIDASAISVETDLD